MLTDTIVRDQAFRQDSNGILQLFDSSRSQWLSVTRSNIYFGINHSNVSCNRWFDSIASVGSNTSSYRIPRNCTITSITIQSQNIANAEIGIRKNNITTDITNIPLSHESGKTLDNLNIELNQNDNIQVFLHVNTGNIDYPVVNIELAWRD